MVTAQQTAIRLTPDDAAILAALQEHFGVSRVDVIRMAIRKLAKSEGVMPSSAPAPSKKK